jgi:pimeloyl-ACP methyl ester carboxylesterase
MPYFNHNGRKLYYERKGEGTITIVFLHGSLGSARKHFGLQLDNEDLQKKLIMIAPDIRGYAHSAKNRFGERITVHQVVDDLHYLIHQELQLKKPFFICGYSLGGIASLEYAKLYPDDVSGFVLVSTLPKVTDSVFVIRNKPINQYKRGKKGNIVRRIIWSAIKRYRKFMTKISLKRRAKKNPNYYLGWESLRIKPKVIIYGKNDTILPRIAFQQLKKCFPDALLEELAADHGITHEKDQIFNKILLDFIFRKKTNKTRNPT